MSTDSFFNYSKAVSNTSIAYLDTDKYSINFIYLILPGLNNLSQ